MKDIVKVTAAILEKDGRIIIAQRKSSDHLSSKWEFPGGKIEPGETPDECLARVSGIVLTRIHISSIQV